MQRAGVAARGNGPDDCIARGGGGGLYLGPGDEPGAVPQRRPSERVRALE